MSTAERSLRGAVGCGVCSILSNHAACREGIGREGPAPTMLRRTKPLKWGQPRGGTGLGSAMNSPSERETGTHTPFTERFYRGAHRGPPAAGRARLLCSLAMLREGNCRIPRRAEASCGVAAGVVAVLVTPRPPGVCDALVATGDRGGGGGELEYGRQHAHHPPIVIATSRR